MYNRQSAISEKFPPKIVIFLYNFMSSIFFLSLFSIPRFHFLLRCIFINPPDYNIINF